MLLRALTMIAVVVGIVFLAYAFMVMSGGRDWLVANMTEEKSAEKVAAKEETPKEAEPAATDSEPAEAPDEAKPDAAMEDEASEDAAVADDAPAPAETAEAEDKSEAAESEDKGDAAAGEEKAEADGAEKPTEGGDAAGVDPAGNPAETAKAAEKGSLKSPYQDSYEEVAEEGHKKYMAAGCNGCHGGTGGGGMGPPLSNPVWVYGNDGDTLFRLIALGSDGLKEQGYTRKGSENVVGPMPPHGSIVKSNDDLWKIIGWIWSINPPDKSASAPQ